MGPRRPRTPAAAWLVAAAAVAALVVVVIFAAVRGPATPLPAAAAATPPAAASGGATDISSLTPRERADRLYDRIMRAHERGDTSELRFFTPMALQAYAMLGGLDSDARYHVGLIHAIRGDAAAARAQADSMPTGHLLAAMLRQRAAIALGDARASEQAYRDFLSNFTREIATDLPEYTAHRPLIDSFRTEAERVTGGSQ